MSPDQPEFIEPTREGRRLLLLQIALAIAVGLAMRFWLMPALFAHINSLPRCEQAHWLWWCVVGISVIPVFIAFWSIPVTIRIFRHEQWPLPGAQVFRRTRIQRGWTARLRGFVLLLASLLALSMPLLGLNAARALMPASQLPGCGEPSRPGPGA